MLVKATQAGFDGMRRIRPGTTFEIRDEAAFSARWMEKVVRKGQEDAKPEAPSMQDEPTVVADQPKKQRSQVVGRNPL